jgi:hypothetical protein
MAQRDNITDMTSAREEAQERLRQIDVGLHHGASFIGMSQPDNAVSICVTTLVFPKFNTERVCAAFQMIHSNIKIS